MILDFISHEVAAGCSHGRESMERLIGRDVSAEGTTGMGVSCRHVVAWTALVLLTTGSRRWRQPVATSWLQARSDGRESMERFRFH